MTEQADYQKIFRRNVLRSAFHSLFWGVILNRKRSNGLRMQEIADRLGVNKSFVSRSFSSPPNWRIDTLADFSDALGIDLVIEAKDRATGCIFTPVGVRDVAATTTSISMEKSEVSLSITTGSPDAPAHSVAL